MPKDVKYKKQNIDYSKPEIRYAFAQALAYLNEGPSRKQPPSSRLPNPPKQMAKPFKGPKGGPHQPDAPQPQSTLCTLNPSPTSPSKQRDEAERNLKRQGVTVRDTFIKTAYFRVALTGIAP